MLKRTKPLPKSNSAKLLKKGLERDVRARFGKSAQNLRAPDVEKSARKAVDSPKLATKTNNTAQEKRTLKDQRKPNRGRATDGEPAERLTAHAGNQADYFIPENQSHMGYFVLLGYALAAGIAQAVPATFALVAAVLSLVLLFMGSYLAGVERLHARKPTLRGLLAVAGLCIPMGLVGIAFAGWITAGLAWQWAVASLVCINAACSAMLGSRTFSLFAAKVSLWTAFALSFPSGLMFSAVGGAALAFILISRIEWKAAQERRERSNARERKAARAEDILRTFEESGQGWFWETDRRGSISYISASAAKVMGRSVEDLHGEPLTAIVDMQSGAAEAERTLGFHLSARSAFREVEVRAANAEKEERYWSLTGRPTYDNFNNFCGFRGHGADLTEKRRSEQQVTRLAHYDSLTGLANRVQMNEALEEILAAPRASERNCTVMMLDLDRFKQVNDTMGHPAGDALLKQVAARLERVIGSIGRCGRLGGDEFQVILPGRNERQALGNIATEIINSLSQPYSIEGQSVVIGASVGVCVAPDDGSNTEELIRNVDLALYAAKDAGRGVHRFYAQELHSAAEEKAELELELREAIQNGGLSLFYQPVVHAASEKIAGFEALMRWHSPSRGWISPEKFVPIAEDAGLIQQMGQWALRKACEDLAIWPETIRCAVNVSPLQFANPELATHVANALAHSRIDPARLELEITESVFLNDSSGTEEMFKALKRLGVRLALDDFGTGYSSLGYLKKAPFNKIKIDQSFVRGATEPGSRNGAIIASITSLAEALEMDTTAEGVETLDELELVRLLGCSHVQGYIYHTPLDAEAASELVKGDMAAEASGPKSARGPRQVTLRRITVVHRNDRITANIRNIAEGGAMIEGLWNIPVGGQLFLQFSEDWHVGASVLWSSQNRVGVQFDSPLQKRADGSFAVLGGGSRSRAKARAQ